MANEGRVNDMRTPDQKRFDKNQRCKQRNIARKEAMARGVSRRDARRLKF